MDNDFERDFLVKTKESLVKDSQNQNAKRRLNVVMLIVIAILIVIIIALSVNLVLISRDLAFYTQMYDDEKVLEVDEELIRENSVIEDIRKIMNCTYGGEKSLGFYSDGTYDIVDLMDAEEIEDGTFVTDWTNTVTLRLLDGNERVAELIDGGLVDNGIRFECAKNDEA